MVSSKDFFPLDESKDLTWRSGKRREAFKCAIMDIREVDRECHDGRKSTFVEVVCPEWVVVIPMFRDGDGTLMVVAERQYRHGSESVTREFPAGIVEKGEKPIVAGKRELLEETGMKAGKWTELARVSPNNAFMTNTQSFFLAEDLEIVSGQRLDDNEEIQVYVEPLKSYIEKIGTGEYSNSIMMSASGFLMRELLKRQ